jgi:hypothetical protein
MGAGGSAEAGNEPQGGGSGQRNDPREPRREERKSRPVRSDSPVNENTPRNAKTKFIIKKDDSDVTNELNLDSSWKQDSKTFENNNQEKQYNDYNRKNNSVLPPRLPTPPQENYPETYAQKGFREQYRASDFMRQKTIYRDPDEWGVLEKVSV